MHDNLSVSTKAACCREVFAIGGVRYMRFPRAIDTNCIRQKHYSVVCTYRLMYSCTCSTKPQWNLQHHNRFISSNAGELR